MECGERKDPFPNFFIAHSKKKKCKLNPSEAVSHQNQNIAIFISCPQKYLFLSLPPETNNGVGKSPETNHPSASLSVIPNPLLPPHHHLDGHEEGVGPHRAAVGDRLRREEA